MDPLAPFLPVLWTEEADVGQDIFVRRTIFPSERNSFPRNTEAENGRFRSRNTG